MSDKVSLLLRGKFIIILLPMERVETVMRLVQTANGNVRILIPDLAGTARAEEALAVAPEVPIVNLDLHSYVERTVSYVVDVDLNLYMKKLIGASAHSVWPPLSAVQPNDRPFAVARLFRGQILIGATVYGVKQYRPTASVLYANANHAGFRFDGLPLRRESRAMSKLGTLDGD